MCQDKENFLCVFCPHRDKCKSEREQDKEKDIK